MVHRSLAIGKSLLAIGIAAILTTAVARAEDAPVNFAEAREAWAFRPPANTPVPAVKNRKWIQSPVDSFVLAKLEQQNLTPAKRADKSVLLRRATFDLIGLPPTVEELEAFLADTSPRAFAKVVDRLLASPHYGERWGRHWLDVVRYTDSFDARGIGGDADVPEAYRYRDWVVEAFNRDLPYDQFIISQLAGDLLATNEPGPFNPDQVIATGLYVIGEWGTGDADKEKMLTDIVDDQIDVTGRAFLGLTLACARCHDHKFDPIPTEDYYGLAGIFFSSHILPNPGVKTAGSSVLRLPLLSAAEIAARKQRESRIAQLEKQLAKTTESNAPDAGEAGLADLSAELAALKKNPPAPIRLAHGLQEGGTPQSAHEGIHDAKVHIRGRYDRLGELVPRHFPRLLAPGEPPPSLDGSGRLELARWIASRDNPLTARVMVNRIWQHHMGEGIVRTPNNFGRLGTPPTHPELLDYLARAFVASGWSIKAMHRTMMLSSTYQQSSIPAPATLKADPDNSLFGRMNRQRLESEAIRDSLLFVAGGLDTAAGGPSIRDLNSRRRTLYVMSIRSDHATYQSLFDAADPASIVEKRITTTGAPQALFLLNHPFALQQTKALAERAQNQPALNDAGRIAWLYQRLYGRAPSMKEKRLGLMALACAVPAGGNDAASCAAAWERYCQVLLCANEFVYVD